MVPHCDHNEHDVDLVVTEQRIADRRGLALCERATLTIENCAHPLYRDLLRDYYRDALKWGGHTPHQLDQAFAWHTRMRDTGSMLPAVEARVEIPGL